MSKKSLDINPDNASYQDTYGYILYKKGKYAQAEVWLKEALAKEGTSADINEHYGDVMYRLGNIDEAVKYWKIARTMGGDPINLDQKINDKKLVD